MNEDVRKMMGVAPIMNKTRDCGGLTLEDTDQCWMDRIKEDTLLLLTPWIKRIGNRRASKWTLSQGGINKERETQLAVADISWS